MALSKNVLKHSIFHEVLICAPRQRQNFDELCLRRPIRFRLPPYASIFDLPWVVFDFETTGLDADVDDIIEIGAQRIERGRVVGEISSLIKPPSQIGSHITKITGITTEMLADQPTIAEILPRLLEFMRGALLIAHNAAFDAAFLECASSNLYYDIEWPVICTLKLARELLPDLERKNLDTLAEYYGLEFEARHRSIGDVKVTVAVLLEMLKSEGENLRTWQDFAPFAVPLPAP